MKIAISSARGGFALSEKALRRILELMGCENIRKKDGYITTMLASLNDEDIRITEFSYSDKDKRTDPLLIQAIEEIGGYEASASGRIKIVEIPLDYTIRMGNDDGGEYVMFNGYRYD